MDSPYKLISFESGDLLLDVVVAGDSWWTAEDCSGVFGDDGPRGRGWRRSAVSLLNDDYRWIGLSIDAVDSFLRWRLSWQLVMLWAMSLFDCICGGNRFLNRCG